MLAGGGFWLKSAVTFFAHIPRVATLPSHVPSPRRPSYFTHTISMLHRCPDWESSCRTCSRPRWSWWRRSRRVLTRR